MPYFEFIDPVEDAEAYQEALDEEQERFIANSPICPICGRRTGEKSNQGYYLFGQWFCESCVENSWGDLPTEGR